MLPATIVPVSVAGPLLSTPPLLEFAEFPLIVAFEKNNLAVRRGHVASGREAADDMMRIRFGGDIADIDERLTWKIRIKTDADQAALPEAIDRQRYERLGQQLVVLDDAQAADLFADEDAAVGGNRQVVISLRISRGADIGHTLSLAGGHVPNCYR